MIKICFSGALLFAERSAREQIEEKLSGIIEENPDEEFQFWFHKCFSLFSMVAMLAIRNLKEKYRGSRLSVIDVIDPWNTEEEKLTKKEREHMDGFPPGAVDQFLEAPLILGKAENYETRFIAHSRKVDRWVWNQCDYMFAYYYRNLPELGRNMAKSASKIIGLTVIQIYEKETEQLLEEEIQALDEFELELIEDVRSGLSYQRIGAKRNKSYQRMRQQTMQIVYRLLHQVRDTLMLQEKCYVRETDFRNFR